MIRWYRALRLWLVMPHGSEKRPPCEFCIKWENVKDAFYCKHCGRKL